MPTGACGINCDVCKLKLLEICSSCGPGRSEEARKKLEAQKRLLGDTCPILACARMNQIDYCLRDCSSFPCDNFSLGPYPFSRGFLDMQTRRRRQRPPALDHNRRPIEVPPEYWHELQRRDLQKLCNFTLARPHPENGLVIPCLARELRVDVDNRRLYWMCDGRPEAADDPLLELVTLLYLNHVQGLYPLGIDLVAPQELKEGHYFKGHHALNLKPLLERYGDDLDGFRRTAEQLGGKALDMADAAYALSLFPRVPVNYLLWKGDEEFPAKVSILFDRSIEQVFAASGIWALVGWVTTRLLQGPPMPVPAATICTGHAQ
jgi:hypothetical protein